MCWTLVGLQAEIPFLLDFTSTLPCFWLLRALARAKSQHYFGSYKQEEEMALSGEFLLVKHSVK